jgi:hypothetical protein
VRDIQDFVLARYELDETAGAIAFDTGPSPPLDLTIDRPASVAWQSGALEIRQEVRLSSGAIASKIIDASKQSNEISIEVWATPVNTTQGGPARLVSISTNEVLRDITLGQEGPDWIVRVRNSATSANGTPNLVAEATAATRLTHLVATHTFTNRMLYVDGARRANDAMGGSLATWAEQPLLVANEAVDFGTRFWRGSIHRIVIFSRALSRTEVEMRFEAGL